MTGAATVSKQQALDDLLGPACKSCGGEKSAGMSHCRKCYFKLPRAMRAALYRRIGSGYERAYAESLEWLAKEKSEGVVQ